MLRRVTGGRTSGLAIGVLAIMALPAAGSVAMADTLESALVQTYVNNPTLNAQRALVRATDETVPQRVFSCFRMSAVFGSDKTGNTFSGSGTSRSVS